MVISLVTSEWLPDGFDMSISKYMTRLYSLLAHSKSGPHLEELLLGAGVIYALTREGVGGSGSGTENFFLTSRGLNLFGLGLTLGKARSNRSDGPIGAQTDLPAYFRGS